MRGGLLGLLTSAEVCHFVGLGEYGFEPYDEDGVVE
jgi:hypothetical protein